MTDAELSDAIDGLFAYDTGATDSGIHDEALRERVVAYLRSLGERAAMAKLATIGRELYLTDAKIAQGYGLEDAAELWRWFAWEMNVF